jgi:hypothetical protein
MQPKRALCFCVICCVFVCGSVVSMSTYDCVDSTWRELRPTGRPVREWIRPTSTERMRAAVCHRLGRQWCAITGRRPDNATLVRDVITCRVTQSPCAGVRHRLGQQWCAITGRGPDNATLVTTVITCRVTQSRAREVVCDL